VRGGGGGKNERDSAEAFRRFAAEATCLEAPLVECVARWVEATAEHKAAPDDSFDLKLFLDFDMMVLARSSSDFDAYSLQVRACVRVLCVRACARACWLAGWLA